LEWRDMHRYVPLALLAVCSCSGSDGLDTRLKPMVGSSENTLLAAMRRPPDGRTDLAPNVAILQWYWRQTYAIPDRLLAYSYAGGTIKPIPHSGTGIVRDECFLEWKVEHGTATAFRWQGAACDLAAQQVGSPARAE
jgi:hypothetical protein